MNASKDLARFEAAQHARDVAREDFIISWITPIAWRMSATVFEVEKATAAGVQALAQGRSRGFAIAAARQQLPRRRNVSTATFSR
jgi:hypothetical protein